jgi:hypothetical protein
MPSASKLPNVKRKARTTGPCFHASTSSAKSGLSNKARFIP